MTAALAYVRDALDAHAPLVVATAVTAVVSSFALVAGLYLYDRRTHQ